MWLGVRSQTLILIKIQHLWDLLKLTRKITLKFGIFQSSYGKTLDLSVLKSNCRDMIENNCTSVIIVQAFLHIDENFQARYGYSRRLIKIREPFIRITGYYRYRIRIIRMSSPGHRSTIWLSKFFFFLCSFRRVRKVFDRRSCSGRNNYFARMCIDGDGHGPWLFPSRPLAGLVMFFKHPKAAKRIVIYPRPTE